MFAESADSRNAHRAPQPAGYTKALVNILDDFASEKAHLEDTQAAILNILGDFTGEKEQLRATQRAVINVLEDAQTEKLQLKETHAAVLNVLGDFAAEKDRLQKTQKELAVSNKELEAFAYSVSHDLRAPLRHLDGFLTLLRKRCYEGLDERGRHYIDAVLSSSQRLGTLIDDLLQFSRLGRAAVRKTLVRPNEIVDELREELQDGLQARKVRWNVGPLPDVTADRGMLRQVFQNLMDNALKFTRTREEAEINIAGAKDEAGNMVISVADNGVGFDMAYSHKLFQVFQRLHGEDEFEGTGIGLANVSRMMQRNDGRVWAQSILGRGTTFYVSLPSATIQIGDEHEPVEPHTAG